MLREYICAARVGLWLCQSAFLVRWCSLPALCRAASAGRRIHSGRLEPSRLAAVVHRVCGLPVFSLPIFPRVCVRRSLALHRELSRMGYATTICFGVRRDGSGLSGHSWVAVNGVPLAEPHPVHALTLTYSYSAPNQP
jgi:hypothetical protein